MLDSRAPGPLNLGNPTERTVLELARTVLALTGSTSEVEYLPLPQDDPVRRRPVVGEARRVLAWEPVVGTEEGLRRTIAWFRAHADEVTAAREAIADGKEALLGADALAGDDLRPAGAAGAPALA